MSTLNQFKKNLAKLSQYAQQISAYQFNMNTKKQAEEALDLIKKFITLLGHTKAITPKDKSELLAVTTKEFQEVRRSLNKKAQSLITEENQKQEQQANKSREEDEAVVQANELFPGVRMAANLVQMASLVTIDNLIIDYRSKRDALQKVIDTLPSDKRKSLAADLSFLNSKVNQLEENALKEREAIKASIRKAAKQAAALTEQLTVGHMLQLLAPQASREQLQQLLSGKAVNALLEGGSAEVNNALVIANLPQSKQTALISILVNQLGLLQRVDSQLGLSQQTAVVQFVQALVRDIEALRKGEKTHLSIVAEGKGNVHVIHIDIHELLTNPIDNITNIAFAFYQQGVTNENITMLLSAPKQAAALQQLAGLNFAQLTEGHQGNVLALTQQASRASASDLTLITGRAVSEDALIAFEDSLLLSAKPGQVGVPVHGKTLEDEQIFSLPQVLSTIAVTHRLLTKPNTLKNVEHLGVAGALGLEGPSSSRLIAPLHKPLGEDIIIEDMPLDDATADQLKAFSSKKDLGNKAFAALAKHKNAAKQGDGAMTLLENAIAEHKVKFNAFIIKLNQLNEALSLKRAKNKNYEKAFTASTALILNLKKAGELFFQKPNHASFDKFKMKCNQLVNEAESEFKNHRGIWHQFHPILKAILGFIATITVIIPAIAIPIKSFHGYKETFFSSPQTASAKRLAELKKELDKDIEDIETAIKPSSSEM